MPWARRLHTLIATLVAALACAVIAHAKGIDPAKLSQVRRIGVIAVLGDHVSVQKIGFTIFTNRYFQLPSDAWDLDGVAIRQASEALQPRFIVEPVVYDKTAFDLDPEHKADFMSGKRMKAAITALPKSDIDAYVLIQRARFYLPYPSNQWIEGLGLPKGGEVLGAREFKLIPMLYAEYWVSLVDARTGKQIGLEFATTTINGKMTSYWGAQQPQDPSDWVDKADAMTEARTSKLRDDLTALLKSSLTDTLGAMGLAGPPSSGGAPPPAR